MFPVRSPLHRLPAVRTRHGLQRAALLARFGAAVLLLAACRESAGPDAVAPSVAEPTAKPDTSSARAASSPGSESAPPGAATHAASAPPSAAATDDATASETSASATGSAAPAAPTSVEAPALLADDGTPLPQTDELPRSDTPAFHQRIELLVRAIAQDAPELAHPAFFPVVAYAQVKAIAKPERDWQQRLIRAFDRTVHAYHRALGPHAASARLLSVEVPDSARHMKPGSEGNRVGYHRVLRSRFSVETADGKTHSLEITSLISWRGEWYIVHLKGFE